MRDDLNKFKYTKEELIEIGKATSQKKPWYAKNIEDIKRRIKEFHLEINHNLCCYCQRSLRDEFRMVIDVEHILPSSKYSSYTFEIWNTSASCKRCNMRIKKDDTDFIVNSKKDHQKSDYYKFAHPNFDEPFKNIIKYSCQFGPNQFVNYKLLNEDKGRYTYKYFELEKIEVHYFDKAQGLNPPSIDDLIGMEVEKISDIN